MGNVPTSPPPKPPKPNPIRQSHCSCSWFTASCHCWTTVVSHYKDHPIEDCATCNPPPKPPGHVARLAAGLLRLTRLTAVVLWRG